MLEIFKRKDDSEQSRYSIVVAAIREALRPIEEKKKQGKLALLRRRRAEMHRSRGLGPVIGVEERLFRADYVDALLKSGVHIMVDALEAEIPLLEKAAADYAEVCKANEEETGKLIAQRNEIDRRIGRLATETQGARSREHQALSLLPQRRRELEGHLEAAEAIGRGANLKSWNPPDDNHPLARQPFQEVGLADLPAYVEGRMSEKEAKKRVDESNRDRHARDQREWDETNRARDLGISVANLRFLESHDKEAA